MRKLNLKMDQLANHIEFTVKCVHLKQILDPETVCGFLIPCAFLSTLGCLSLLDLDLSVLPQKPQNRATWRSICRLGAVCGWECGLSLHEANVNFRKLSTRSVQRTQRSICLFAHNLINLFIFCIQ